LRVGRICLGWVGFCVLAGCGGDEPGRSGLSEPGVLSLPIRVMLYQGQEVRVSCIDGGYTILDPIDARVIVSSGAKQATVITRKDGQWQLGKPTSRRSESIGEIQSEVLEITSQAGGFLTLGESQKRSYRGSFQLHSLGEGRFGVVNILEVEDYLESVVPGEMYSNWHPSALRAQAIASRTYALFERAHAGGKRKWDLSSDQRSQVYQGVFGENWKTSQAVRDTRGIVVAFGRENEEKIFPTFYSSICGGHTESATALIGQSIRPLDGQLCDYCREVSREHFDWKAVTLSKEDVSERLIGRYARLAELEEISDIRILERSDYGRVETLQLVGKNGKSMRLRAENFRLTLSTKEKSIRSNWYRLVDAGSHWRFEEGRGWGHGVGMCQYGCWGMAKAGQSACASAILSSIPSPAQA